MPANQQAEPTPNRSVTERGFDTYDEFTDSYGAEITVRQSSAASARKVWIFVQGGIEGNDGAAHLTVSQATRVRDALDAFIREAGQ